MKKSLRQKLVPALFAVSCIPIAVLAAISQIRLRNSTKENLNEQAEAELRKAEQCMDIIFDKYETILYDIATDDEVVGLIETIQEKEDAMEVNSNRLRREFSHVCNRNEGVEGIQVILGDDRRIFYDRRSSSSVNTSWLTQTGLPETGRVLFYDAGTVPGTEQQPVFQIYRKVIDYRDIHKDMGHLVLSVSREKIVEAVETGSRSWITIKQESYLVAGDQGEAGQNKITTKQRVNQRSGWTLELSQPLGEYHKAIREQALFWFLVAAALLGVLVALLYRATRPVLVSVEEIVRSMGSVEEGDFTVRLPVRTKDSSEFQMIAERFNEMVKRTEALIRQVRQSALEQKNAEISALEAQIDPHFLYNILDTINWKAIEKEQYEISDMLVALADILRYAIKNPGEETTIAAEREWLSRYMLLQQEKLGEEIQVCFFVEKGLERQPVHKMLLQPFVENAVKYGFHGTEGPHRLDIKVSRAEGQLHIQVQNNGKAMPENQRKSLNRREDMPGHVGISNVRKRLKLYYGEETGIYFEEAQGGGVRVHLFLPMQKEGEKE